MVDAFNSLPMLIRLATSLDAELVASLVIDASLSVKDQDFSDQGWALLEKTNTVEAVSKRFESDQYFALILEVEGRPAGYIALLNFEKIDHLFVLPAYRQMGFAKRLWLEAKGMCCKYGNKSYFWVRSSTYATPVYASFGFRCTGGRQQVKGISFQLMEYGEK